MGLFSPLQLSWMVYYRERLCVVKFAPNRDDRITLLVLRQMFYPSLVLRFGPRNWRVKCDDGRHHQRDRCVILLGRGNRMELNAFPFLFN